MLSWDDFLEKLANAHNLVKKDKNAFLVRFAQRNLHPHQLDAKVAEALYMSEPNLQKYLGKVYAIFASSCPSLKTTTTKGKFEILHDWLETMYVRYQKTGELPGLPKTSDLGVGKSAIADRTQDQGEPEDCYVERPSVESQCNQTLLQPGSLLHIKALRQMGKTTLITRVLDRLEAFEGYRTVILSFKLADETHYANLNKFLRWFCTNVSRELELPNQLDDYWEEEAGSKSNCTTYFEKYLLLKDDSPLVLCLDDVDLIFPHPEIYEHFFVLLRFWHERAKRRQLWKKLRLVVIHSTEVYIQLNIHQSPFNVSVPIELPEFTSEQVQDFSQQHGLDWDTVQIEPLIKMVGGHPELLQQAFSFLKSSRNATLEKLLAMAPTEDGIYGSHLREHLRNLQKEPELAVAFKKVITATTDLQLEPMQAYKLSRMGLVRLSDNQVKPRCILYSQYFSDRLGDT